MATKVIEGSGLTASEVRLKVMSNPKRRRLLMIYRDKGPIAQSEMEVDARMPLSDISYHSRFLLRHGYIEAVKTEAIRGALKTWYVATERHVIDGTEWESMDELLKEGMALDGIEPLLEDFERAARAHLFDDDPTLHITRVPIKSVDQQGYEELAAAHRRLLEETNEISTRSAERMAESGENPISISSGQQCFRVPKF